MTLAQRTTSPPEKKFNIDKQYPKRIHTSHSLLLLGDSHIRGLTEKISCNLANSFGVMGTIKPNADIMGITSSRYITPTNLTKHDIIIFYGGTRDISRNNSKNGLHALKEFVQRASNLLTPWCRVLLEKLAGLQLVKKFPAFYGPRRFITAFTSFRHPSLSWASPIQSIYPQPTS